MAGGEYSRAPPLYETLVLHVSMDTPVNLENGNDKRMKE